MEQHQEDHNDGALCQRTSQTDTLRTKHQEKYLKELAKKMYSWADVTKCRRQKAMAMKAAATLKQQQQGQMQLMGLPTVACQGLGPPPT
jgi:hypothetical protein